MQQIPEIVKSKAVVVGAWNNMTRYSGYYDWWIPGTREHCEISGFDSALLNKFVNLKIVMVDGIWSYNNTLLDFSWNDKLETILINSSSEKKSVRTIDLRGCEALTLISFRHFPNLSTIDLSDCKELRGLSLCDMPLTSIDLSFAPNLESLSLFDTNIKFVDLSNNPRIQKFLTNSIEKVTLNRLYTYSNSLMDTLRKDKVIIEYK